MTIRGTAGAPPPPVSEDDSWVQLWRASGGQGRTEDLGEPVERYRRILTALRCGDALSVEQLAKATDQSVLEAAEDVVALRTQDLVKVEGSPGFEKVTLA